MILKDTLFLINFRVENFKSLIKIYSVNKVSLRVLERWGVKEKCLKVTYFLIAPYLHYIYYEKIKYLLVRRKVFFDGEKHSTR